MQWIIENKLKKLAKNKSAVNALNALKAEIKAQRKRYNDMRALWNSEDLIRFFTDDSERLAKNVNSYKALKESYYKILDDYEPPLAPQKIADERALKSVDELNLSENLDKSQGENLNQARDEIIKLEQSIFYEKRENERLKEMLQRYKDDERTLEHLEVNNKKLEQLTNKKKN